METFLQQAASALLSVTQDAFGVAVEAAAEEMAGLAWANVKTCFHPGPCHSENCTIFLGQLLWEQVLDEPWRAFRVDIRARLSYSAPLAAAWQGGGGPQSLRMRVV